MQIFNVVFQVQLLYRCQLNQLFVQKKKKIPKIIRGPWPPGLPDATVKSGYLIGISASINES